MAEVLGTVASAIAVAQAAGALIKLSQQIVSVAQTVKNAPELIQAITDRVGTLESVLEKLKDTADAADQSDKSAGGLADLSAPRGALANCRNCLKKLEDLLPSESDTSDYKHGVRKAISKLKLGIKWSLKSSEVNALLEDVGRHQIDIQSHLALAAHNHTRKTKKHVYIIHDTLKDNERREYYKWLEKDFKDYDEIQMKWSATREEDTCKWILQDVRWQNWLSGKSAHRLLWINGIMGTGKTILTSFIIDHFKALYPQGDETAMAYYYCHYTHNCDESEPFLRCILGQLCRHMQSVPCSLMDCFRDDLSIGVDRILVAIEECLTELAVAYVVLDALDESLQCKPLLATIKCLTKEDRFSKLRLVATSRPETVVEETLRPVSTAIRLTQFQVGEDIKRHIASTLRAEEFCWWPAELKSDVALDVSNRASGMFRLASSQLDLLSRLTTEEEVRRGLKMLPDTIYESYDRIMPTLSKEQRSVVLGVLVMIKFFMHGTHYDYISSLPRILAASTAHKKFSSSMADYKTIRRWCGSLISVHRASTGARSRRCGSAEPCDETEQSTVDISHRSVFEYLAIYLEREKLTTKQDFVAGIFELCATSRALTQDHSLLGCLFSKSYQFQNMIPHQAELRSAYYRYLRSVLHMWLTNLFDHKIAHEAQMFSETCMPMRKTILLRLLCILWAHKQGFMIRKCCRVIGFSSLLETNKGWNGWDELGINYPFVFTPDEKAGVMLLIHDGGASCGEVCYLRSKPAKTNWRLLHIALAMACVDYEALVEITKGPISPLFKTHDFFILNLVVNTGDFPGISSGEFVHMLVFESILEFYDYLSSKAVFSGPKRQVWEDIGLLLAEKRRLQAEAYSMIADEPSLPDEPSPPDEGEQLLNHIPYRTEEEMVALKRKLDDYVDEVIDILAASWV